MSSEKDNKSSDLEGKAVKSSSSSDKDDRSKSKSRSRSRDNERRGGSGNGRSSRHRRGKRDSSKSSNDSKGSDRRGSKHYRHNKRTTYRDFKSTKERVNQPGLHGPMINFKTFMEMQHQHIDPEAAQKCYDEYKAEHQKKQADIFFNMHKEEHWFKEKYYPEQAYQWKLEQIAQSKLIARSFVDNFVDKSDSKLPELCLDEQASVNYQDMINAESDEVSGPPLFGFDVN